MYINIIKYYTMPKYQNTIITQSSINAYLFFIPSNIYELAAYIVYINIKTSIMHINLNCGSTQKFSRKNTFIFMNCPKLTFQTFAWKFI